MINFSELQFIFKPSYWYQNNPYSKDVDEIILSLLDEHEFTDIEGYTAKLGNAEIWIENRPYASIRLWNSKLRDLRPSRLTIRKALKKLEEAELKEHEKIIKQEKIRFLGNK